MDELDETILFCEQAGFDWVWCHSFSARPETPATMLSEQLSPEEIHRRARLVKSRLGKKSLISTEDDTSGSKTCQG